MSSDDRSAGSPERPDALTPPPLEVLMHPVVDDRAAPYLIRLAEALSEVNVTVRRLRATALLRGGPRIVHIHWPEHVVRGSGPWARRAAKQVEAAAIAALLWLRRRDRVVWTVHNLEPHDGWNGPLERILFAVVRRRLGGLVVLVPGHHQVVLQRYPELAGARVAEAASGPLMAGSIRDPLTSAPPRRRDEGAPVAVLMIGAIAPYKQQLEVVQWLAPALEQGRATLRLIGAVGDPTYRDAIEVAAPRRGLQLETGWMPDADLAARIVDHDVVVAVQHNTAERPATANERSDEASGGRSGETADGVSNTGVPYAVLPLGVPVAMSPGAQAEELRRSQGDAWVYVLDPVRPWGDPESFLAWAARDRPEPSPGPWDWQQQARAHRRLYDDINPDPA